MALRWWEAVLATDLQQCWGWNDVVRPWLHLYADARGDPPHIAAVLFADSRTYFCDMATPCEVLQCFKYRKDNQILGQEMLSIALGLSSFAGVLSHRRVVIWSDNVGAESATRSAKARSFDHTCLAHCLWTKLIELKAEAYIQRVPSKFNIADLPSRGEYGLLESMGAKRVPAVLDSMFWQPAAWSSLSVVLSKMLLSGGGDRASVQQWPCVAVHAGIV